MSPSLRWYSQSQAFFYAPFYDAFRGDGFASSDYRLSPYGALSARLDVLKSIGALSIGAGVEYYEADGSYAIRKVGRREPGAGRVSQSVGQAQLSVLSTTEKPLSDLRKGALKHVAIGKLGHPER